MHTQMPDVSHTLLGLILMVVAITAGEAGVNAVDGIGLIHQLLSVILQVTSLLSFAVFMVVNWSKLVAQIKNWFI